MIDATQIRKGMIIIMDGTLYRVMEMQLITPGRWKAMVQTKLRNIKEGSQIEYRFRSEERVDQAMQPLVRHQAAQESYAQRFSAASRRGRQRNAGGAISAVHHRRLRPRE